MNIIKSIQDDNLLRPFLGPKLKTWRTWMAALRVLYGLSIDDERAEVMRRCTGRDPAKFPKRGFDTALFLTGRRSGKSRCAAVIGAYEASLAGHETKLAKGEKGVVAVCAPTKLQGRIVKDYLRSIFDAPMLRNEVIGETRDGFELSNGIRISIQSGDWRTIRGFTLVAAIVDEAAFFGLDEEAKVRSDSELIRAIRPSLATTGGKLVAISSPYARKGWTYQTHQKNFANDAGRVLVVNAPSRTMNPTLPQSVVDDAMAEDMQAAKSEYLAEFRDDVAEFLPREVIENLVVKGRRELLPRKHLRYHAFVDLSGGRHDDAALAIAHLEDRTVVLDSIKRYRPPFNPHGVVSLMAEFVKQYGIRRVTGDNYAADFVARAFEGCGLRYAKSPKPKSILYAELLPRITSGEIELLDDDLLVKQLAGLERRTRSGGKDVIDHAPGAHDDVANAVAGVATSAFVRVIEIGAI